MSILNHDNESDGFRSLISCLCFYPASNITHLTYVQTGDSQPWITSLSGSRPSNASCSRPVTSTQHILSKWPKPPQVHRPGIPIALSYLRHMPVRVQMFLGMITTIKLCLIWFYFLASCVMMLVPNQPLHFVGEKDVCKIDDFLVSLPSLCWN